MKENSVKGKHLKKIITECGKEPNNEFDTIYTTENYQSSESSHVVKKHRSSSYQSKKSKAKMLRVNCSNEMRKSKVQGTVESPKFLKSSDMGFWLRVSDWVTLKDKDTYKQD